MVKSIPLASLLFWCSGTIGEKRKGSLKQNHMKGTEGKAVAFVVCFLKSVLTEEGIRSVPTNNATKRYAFVLATGMDSGCKIIKHQKAEIM